MTPDGALLNADGPHDHQDIRPVFVNDDLNDSAERDDWWLDLGHIDLPA